MSMPSDWIDGIHQRLHARYGDAWLKKWAGLDMGVVKNDWASVLHGLTRAAVEHALGHLPEFAPTAGQFRSIGALALREERQPLALPRPGIKADPDRVRELIGRIQRPQETVNQRQALIARLEAREARGEACGVHREALARLRLMDDATPMAQQGNFNPIPQSEWPWVKRGEDPRGVESRT
jgi:hypothetical protein